MTPTENRQAITMPAEGEALKAIRDRAAADDLPLGRAALAIFAEGMRAIAFMAELDEEPDAPVPAIVDLSIVPSEWLTTEIARRLATAPSQAEIAAERARADEALGRLGRVQALLAGAE